MSAKKSKLSGRFAEAFHFASSLHLAQIRKGTDIPYVAHLLMVAGIVLEHGGSEDEAIAALLHDALEDQGRPGVREEIERRFGGKVLKIVEGCTDAEAHPRPPWRARKEKFLADLPRLPPATRLVEAADKLHNAQAILRDYRALGDRLWSRFSGGKEGVLWYYRAAVGAFKQAGNSPLLEELDRVVTELERLAAK